MPFAKTFGDKYGKKLIDTATKTRIDERVVQKPTEAIGDLTENKIANKITSVGTKK